MVDVGRTKRPTANICLTVWLDAAPARPIFPPTWVGYLGNPGAPQMRAKVEKALLKIQSHGKAAGLLIGDLALARHYVEFAATFVAIGNDVAVFANAAA